MAEKTLKTRIIQKHDTEANWLLATNFTPMNGEIIIYDEDDNHDYKRIKIGNGIDNVNDLDFVVNKEDVPTQVQADWDQNDEKSNSYIKNRSHYIGFECIELLKGITRGSNANGLILYTYYGPAAPADTDMNVFVSDIIKEGATMQLSMDPQQNSDNFSLLFQGNLSYYSTVDATDNNVYDYHIFGNMSYLSNMASKLKIDFGTNEDTGEKAVVVIEKRTLNGELINNYPKVYVCFDQNKIGSSLPQFKIDNLRETVIQLDEKFIPNTIARKADIPEVDLTSYQTKSDENLTTTDKTIVGAINEIEDGLVGENTTGTIYTIDNESVTAAEGAEIFNDYTNNKAVGKYSHAEGSTTIATGEASHAEGQNTTASGIHSHAEGLLTEAIKAGSHAEGISSKASGDYSHAEGFYTESNGIGSHAEGGNLDRGGSTATSTYTVSSKDYSEITTPITVNGSIAQGIHSHVEGAQSLAYGYASHAEGEKSKAFNAASHAEGTDTKSSGYASHAEGNMTKATGMGSHAEGMNSKATGDMSHAEGNGAQASGTFSHAEGLQAKASAMGAHAEGNNSQATANYAHAEGTSTVASGENSHAEGSATTASGAMSHAEGNSMNKLPSGITSTTSNTNIISTWNSTKFTLAKGQSSHAEGENVLALNAASHAEGQMTIASGAYSHAEGLQTKASDAASHAEGNMTEASGTFAHAEGNLSIASGAMSHAEGYGTIAKSNFQHVEGQYNIEDSTNKYAHIVGNGSGNARSNAHTVDWDGNAWFAGDVYIGGASQDDGSKLITEAKVDEKISEINIPEAQEQVQPDWNVLDENNPVYIKNKPFDYEIEYTLINSNELTIGSDPLSEEDWALTGGHGIALVENEYYMITFNDKTYIEKCIKYRETDTELDLRIGDKIKTPFEIVNNHAYGFAIYFSKEYDKNSFVEIKKLKIKDTPSHFIKDMYYSERGDYYQGKVNFFLNTELNKSTGTIYFDKDIFKDISNLSYVKIEWDGIEYVSMVLLDNDSSDFKDYYIGNLKLVENLGGSGEALKYFNFSEPFLMRYSYHEWNSSNIRGFESALGILTTDTEATEHTIRIFDDEHQDIIHQIDKKYIPFNGADWEEVNPSKLSYIKNKPFGKTNEEIIVEYKHWPNEDGEEGVDSSITATMSDMSNLFEIGKKYEVTIDGKTYITECKYLIDSESNDKYMFIGNEMLWAICSQNEENINKAIDTGENFAFTHIPSYGFLFGVVKGFKPLEGVTYGIKKINIDYLPHYYIKDMYYSETNENIFIQEQFIHGFTDATEMGFNGRMVVMTNAYPGEKPLVPNQTYKIVWDGVEYECLAVSGAPDDADYVEIYMGNLSPMGEEDTGEPFIIAYTEEAGMNQFMIGTPSTEERHKLKIYQGDSVETIHQIPSKYVDAYTKPEIDNKLENISFKVDSSLSATSTNPVENKVVNSAIVTLTSAIGANTDSITAHSTAITNLQTIVEEIQEVTSAEIQALFNGTGLEIPPGEGDDLPDPVED